MFLALRRGFAQPTGHNAYQPHTAPHFPPVSGATSNAERVIGGNFVLGEFEVKTEANFFALHATRSGRRFRYKKTKNYQLP
jgi:hypothetical protein